MDGARTAHRPDAATRGRRGRLWRDSRAVLKGILWILLTRAQWADLPERYPPFRPVIGTCSAGCATGRWSGCSKRWPKISRNGGLDLSECFIGGTFVAAKKGGLRGSDQAGQRHEPHGQSWAVADRFGLPVAVCAASAAPHEITLVAVTLDYRFVDALPERLIGDRAYDADPLDAGLAALSVDALSVEMIAPHRRKWKRCKTQDGRKLRRYKRRWKVGRLFAWLGNFRRLIVRCERHALNELGLVHLGCLLLLLRQTVRDGFLKATRKRPVSPV